ncbi:MAG: beta-lactamase family protein [Flavobacteriales bacterium]|nr:beta-lactamase family protein [Flavobacteriales bacterium]
MLRYPLYLISLILLSSCIKTESQKEQIKLPKEISAEVLHRVESGINQGIAIATIDSIGNINYYNFGTASSEGEAISENSLFEIASLSKTFTSTLIKELALEHQFSLDSSIVAYLPDSFPEAIKQITFQELINHTSGLARLPIDFWAKDWSNPYQNYSEQEFIEDLDALELDSAHQWNYSNLGYALLGYIIERNFDMSLQNFIDEIGLTSSLLLVTGKNEMTSPHNFGVKVSHWGFPHSLSYLGGIKSTTKDLAQYVKYLQEHNPVFQALLHDSNDVEINYAQSLYMNDGWLVDKTSAERIVFHNGISGGYSSFIGYQAFTKKGIIILSNSQSSIDIIGLSYLSDVFKITPAKKDVSFLLEKLIERKQLDSLSIVWESYDSLNYIQSLGACYWLQCNSISNKDYKAALALNKLMMNDFPDDWEVYFYRGKIYQEMGETEKAVHFFDQVDSLFPSNQFMEQHRRK